MKKVIGFCNLHDDPSLELLTKNRPLGAVSFLGRYALIDFTLSNFTNSHIDNVFVLIRHGGVSLRTHIGNGSIWSNNTKLGYLKLVYNEEGFSKPKFNTDIANLKLNFDVENTDFDYAVFAPACMPASLDYRPYIEAHKESKADVSIIYSHVKNDGEEYVNCDALTLDKNDKVLKIETNLGNAKEVDISIESFIVSKNALKKILSESENISKIYSLRQVISYMTNRGSLNVNALRFDGYFVPILDIDHYIKHSFDLLRIEQRNKLFIPEWPIYTTTHNTPPTLYSKDAEVSNSFIANGAIVKGKVENSIISRDVIIEKDAVVKNSIIFTNTYIGEGCVVDHVLSDKKVKIVTSKDVSGKEDHLLYLELGAKI